MCINSFLFLIKIRLLSEITRMAFLSFIIVFKDNVKFSLFQNIFSTKKYAYIAIKKYEGRKYKQYVTMFSLCNLQVNSRTMDIELKCLTRTKMH